MKMINIPLTNKVIVDKDDVCHVKYLNILNAVMLKAKYTNNQFTCYSDGGVWYVAIHLPTKDIPIKRFDTRDVEYNERLAKELVDILNEQL